MEVLTIETEQRSENIRLLEDRIYEHNVQVTGISDGELLAVFLRDDGQAVVGGLYGWTWGAACYIRYLYVPEPMRRQGHGRRLMGLVEAEARARGCGQIILETHDFQAPDFYRRLGFEVVGRVEDYPSGHQSFTMVKRLVA